MNELQPTNAIPVLQSEGDFISKRGSGCFGANAEIILNLSINDQVCGKTHLRGSVGAKRREQFGRVSRAPTCVANLLDGLHDLILCEQMEETNGVEQIGLADPVGPCNAGEWAKTHLDVEQVLEASHAQTGKHVTSQP
jgi:hypothetical protein